MQHQVGCQSDDCCTAAVLHTATTFLRGTNTANFRIRRPSLAPLTNCQTDQTEAVQKRAINIIHNCTWGMPYSNALFLAGKVK